MSSSNVLLSKQIRASTANAWSNRAIKKEVVFFRDDCKTKIPKTYWFPSGGSLTVLRAVLGNKEQKDIYDEAMTSGCFRTYQIQATKEPRTHFLLHEDATENSGYGSGKPGYRYGGITMQAQPLSKLPKVNALAKKMEEITLKHVKEETAYYRGAYWNVGVNVILYRDGNDSIGMHKDAAQGEERVFTVIPHCPVQRRILIESDDNLERYELFLNAGDAYCMDGEMQKYYKHGVPKIASNKDVKCDRMAIVLRRGTQCYFPRDSGASLADLSPRSSRVLQFGQLPGLEEGKCYGPEIFREELNAHNSQQCGVSGNRHDGCNAIVVTQRPKNDYLFEFDYSVRRHNGFYGLKKSAIDGLSIRVFRSSKGTSKFSPPQVMKGSGSTYRYDGLYFACFIGHHTEITGSKNYIFKMRRYQEKNKLSNFALASTCIYYRTMAKHVALDIMAQLKEISYSRRRCIDRNPAQQLGKVHSRAGSWRVSENSAFCTFRRSALLSTSVAECSARVDHIEAPSFKSVQRVSLTCKGCVVMRPTPPEFSPPRQLWRNRKRPALQSGMGFDDRPKFTRSYPSLALLERTSKPYTQIGPFVDAYASI